MPKSVARRLKSASSGKLNSRQPSRNSPTRRSPLRLGLATLEVLLQLLQDRGVFQGGDVLGDRFALGDRAQQPAHDLPGARLWQVVAEADVLGLGDRADLLAD